MSANPTHLRRRPVQQRSAMRVERMLEACALLIDEVGYDGVTTTLIAERAGVAVGSLYQFFPDKRAVVQALTTRNLDRFMELIAERLASATLEHWWDAVDMVFDAYVQMYRHVPGFTQIRFGDVVDLRLMDDQRDNNTVIADRLAMLLADRFALPHTQLWARHAAVITPHIGVRMWCSDDGPSRPRRRQLQFSDRSRIGCGKHQRRSHRGAGRANEKRAATDSRSNPMRHRKVTLDRGPPRSARS